MSQVFIVGLQFSSFTRSVQLCCEELNLDYSLGTEYNNKNYKLHSSELKELNPFGKIPVLIHQGRVLYESACICRYLDDTFNSSKLQPTDAWERILMDQWCSAVSNQIDKVIVRNYLLEFLFPKGPNGSVRMEVVQNAIPEIISIVSILESQLSNKSYLLGSEFTLADIMLVPIMHYLSKGPNNEKLISADSKLRDYVQRIMLRPSTQKVLS